MRYVTEINYGWQSKRRSAIVSPFESTSGNIKVRDTKERTIEALDIRCRAFDFLGLGVDMEDGSVVAVKHTIKTANLHKHIAFAQTRICDPSAFTSGEAIAVLCEGHLVGMRDVCNDHRILAINTGSEMIKVTGLLGSVTMRQSAPCDTPSVWTLYDLLGALCSESDLNVMTWHMLRLYSQDRRYETVLRFSQTEKARRFFTKMYFDVTGSSL